MNFLLLLLAALALVAAQMNNCTTQTIENPIWQLFPRNVTAIINATIALFPIPLSIARAIIPAEYNILTDAYKSLLPNFPDDLYPAIFQSEFDHDIQVGNSSMPSSELTEESAHSEGEEMNTFSFQHASLQWPFLDLLGDDSTCFSWQPDTFESAGAMVELNGTEALGATVYPADFSPVCDAYAAVPGGTSVNATNSSCIFVESIWTQVGEPSDFQGWLAFFNNVTNQPSFANSSMASCDNQIRFFPMINVGLYAAKPVQGSIRVQTPLLGTEMCGEELVGIQIATPYLENYGTTILCNDLKGYGGKEILPGWMTGTGEGSGIDWTLLGLF